MQVTLKRICHVKKYSAFELLKAKKELIAYKKQGRLFFTCDLGNLGWDDEFSLYYHAVPNKRSEVNAFPVPLEEFQVHKKQTMQARYLKAYFENYYGIHWQDAYFSEYNAQKPFIGENFAWYFKRSVCFS